MNHQDEFKPYGEWVRQDPGFPDAIFVGNVNPRPGFEIKAWFPLATEITARFKDSQNHFAENNIYVAMLAWLPERLIYGKPKILDVCIVSALSVAEARDQHYHNPPDYLVLEPEDTASRTQNLQQTNTNGYKWQGTDEEFKEASELVESWGNEESIYQPTPKYQVKLKELRSHYSYRLDTNFAKMDRIAHTGIEAFKERVDKITFNGMTIREWKAVLSNEDDSVVRNALEQHLGIKEEDADDLLK